MDVNTVTKEYPNITDGYFNLTPEQKLKFCNGCGSRLAKLDFVPDSFWGLPVTEVCNVHDYMYHIGVTLEDKELADIGYRNNLYFHIDLYTNNWFLKQLRYWQARKYYYCVKWFGYKSFIEKQGVE